MTTTINPNSIYTISYAEVIGHNLTSCLHFSVTLITKEIVNFFRATLNPFGSWFSTLFRLATLSLSFFALIVFLPVSLSLYFLGKIVSLFSTLKINTNSLKKVPNPVIIPDDLEKTSTGILLTTCQDLLPQSISHLRTILTYPNTEYQRALKGIAYQFKALTEEGSPLLSSDLKKRILQRLVDAQKACVETWVRVASTIFTELFTSPNNIEQTILRLVMEYKDQVALNFAQNSLNLEWHIVSGIKQVIGNDIGLPATLSDEEDQYGSSSVPVLRSLKYLALYHFLHPYNNSNALVVAITASLNLASNKKEIYDFLYTELSDSETLLLDPEFADYNTHTREIVIKEKAAVYLLKKYHILV